MWKSRAAVAHAAICRSSRRALATPSGTTDVVLVDGCRIPFQPSGTAYNDLMAYDLSRHAMKGLVTKTGVPPSAVDYVIWGTVIQEVKTSNIARDAAIGAGMPNNIPAHTVTQACISSNQAICSAMSHIKAGQAEVVLAGGVETFSDVPIRFSRPLRKAFISLGKAKTMSKKMKLFSGVKAKDLAPEAPAIANFTTGEVMGHNTDRLCDRFGITREEQDAYALRSHLAAHQAHLDGIYKDEIIPVNGSTEEGGIRKDATIEKMATLKPAFVKPHGTVTAANSSFLTDGAAATLLMSEAKAKELEFTPKAYLRDWAFVSCDPFEDLLLGPTYAVTKVLKKAGLTLKDIDVIEFHEAFAGQILSNLKALDSEAFYTKSMPGMQKVGAMPMEKFNVHGGSLSIGHPFGATGARLFTTVSNRLKREDGRFGLIAACADGGIGHAAIVERYA